MSCADFYVRGTFGDNVEVSVVRKAEDIPWLDLYLRVKAREELMLSGGADMPTIGLGRHGMPVVASAAVPIVTGKGGERQ